MSESLSLLTELPESFVSNFSKNLASRLKDVYPNRLADISTTELSQAIEGQLSTQIPKSIPLSKSRPDFESILVQLMSEVERNGLWVDTDYSATGQLILRNIATDVDYSQFSIARALQEAYLDTARADSSVFLGARTLGNRLIRHKPARVDVALSRLDNSVYYTLPALTQFDIEGEFFFSRSDSTFLIDILEINIVLHQGRLRTVDIESTGVPYQTIEIGNEQGNISDEDIYVWVDGEEWTKITDPLWHYGPDSKVFYEATLQNGDVEIRFGNGITGASPAAGVTISITYAETKGFAGNSTANGQKVTVYQADTDAAEVIGVTESPVTEGSDRKDALFYRLFASDRRAAQKRSVRRSDYRAMALEYPGVIDARFRGQAELNPTKPSWLNIVGATLLTDPVFTQAQWLRFQEFMATKGIFQTQMLRLDPEILTYDLSIDVYCSMEANLDQVKRVLEQQIIDKTTPKATSLGYSWYASDFDELALGEGPIQKLIKYAVVNSPTVDIVCEDSYQWAKMNSLTINMFYTRRGEYQGRLDNNPFSDESGTPIT